MCTPRLACVCLCRLRVFICDSTALAIVIYVRLSRAVSKEDPASVTAMLCPKDPLAPAILINDNELLEKGFSLRLSRKQLSALDEANESAAQLVLSSNRVETRFTKPYVAAAYATDSRNIDS